MRLLRNKYLWLVVASFAIGFYFIPNFKKAETANIGEVIRGEIVQRVTIAGIVNPNRKTVISAPYNGYVRKIYVEIGQHVRAGDPIVSMAQSLRGSSEEVYPLRAPFEGTVVQVLKTEGEYVEQAGNQTTNALVRIDDLTTLFVEATAPEIEVSKLKVGQQTIIKASAVIDRSYKGKIEHISLAAKEQKDWDKSRVEFPVLIRVSDNDTQLQPGMTVIVDIITKKLTNVLSLRHEFIQRSGEKYFAVTENGEKKEIQVGLQNEEAFEIKSGLKEGDKIRQTDFLAITK